MKSKFYLCALFCAVVGTSVISSCKDTDEDLYLDFKNQLAKEDEKINGMNGNLNQRIDSLGNELDDLRDSVIDILSVNVEQVYTPAFGTIALPFGVKSNVLMGYYGVASTDNFPALDPAELSDLGVIAKSCDLSSAKDVNLGTIALTVNPTDIDYSGAVATLMNAKGVQSGVALSELEVATELKFGYTRAASAPKPGLYCTTATVADVTKINKIEFDAVKESGKKLASALTGKGIDGTTVVTELYKLVNETLATDCNAVSVVAPNNPKRNVVSGYDIAAVMVNPLGFSSASALFNSRYVKKLRSWADLKSVSATIKFEDKTGTATFDFPAAVQRILAKVAQQIDALEVRINPALFATANGTTKLLGVDAANPAIVDADVELHATSFTSEILVPFAKKFVAVTEVINGSADAAKNANEAMAEVVDGPADYVIKLSGLESGATYKVAYSAMDFAGKIKTEYFYFKVK